MAPIPSAVVSVTLAGVALDLGDDNEEDDENWWTDDFAAQWYKLDHDYYDALGLRKGSLSTSSIYAAYHRRAHCCHPDHVKVRGAHARRAALLSFYMITEAFLVLSHVHRKRVLDECGLKALRQSENYAAESLFDADPYHVFDNFYSGDDPIARDYLLSIALDTEDEDEVHQWDYYGDNKDISASIAINPSLDPQCTAIMPMLAPTEFKWNDTKTLDTLLGASQGPVSNSMEPELRDMVNDVLARVPAKSVSFARLPTSSRRGRTLRTLIRQHRARSNVIILRKMLKRKLSPKTRLQGKTV